MSALPFRAAPEVSEKTSEPPATEKPGPDPARARARGDTKRNAIATPGVQESRSCTYHAIFGRKGMGKTLLARSLFRARIRAGGSGIFLDPKGENGDLGFAAGSVGELWAHIRGKLNTGRPFAAVLAPSRWEAGTDLGDFWQLVWELGDLLLVVDETQQWGSAEYIEPGFKNLVGLARSHRIDMVFTMQTPPMLCKQIRGNLDVLTTFRQPELDYAAGINKNWFNLPDPTLLQRLPKFVYLRSQLDRSPPVTRGRVDPDRA